MMGRCPTPTSCIDAPSTRVNAGRLRRRRRAARRRRARPRRRRRPAAPGSTCTPAYVEAETGDRDAARRSAAAALLDRRDLEPETRGLVWSQLALLRHAHRRRPTRALDAFAHGRSRCSHDAPRDLGRALLNRGNVHLQRGDAAAAAADFAAARELLDDATDSSVERAKAEHNLGYAQLLTGDLVGALQAMDDARQVLAPLSPV